MAIDHQVRLRVLHILMVANRDAVPHKPVQVAHLAPVLHRQVHLKDNKIDPPIDPKLAPTTVLMAAMAAMAAMVVAVVDITAVAVTALA